MPRIVYGYVMLTEGLKREIDEGRIALGGCCVSRNDPAQKCLDCGLQWGGGAKDRGAAARRPPARGATGR